MVIPKGDVEAPRKRTEVVARWWKYDKGSAWTT